MCMLNKGGGEGEEEGDVLILNLQLLYWACKVLGARTEVKGQPWLPFSQEELQDFSSIESLCSKYA